jgi:hypothetical protein
MSNLLISKEADVIPEAIVSSTCKIGSCKVIKALVPVIQFYSVSAKPLSNATLNTDQAIQDYEPS